MASGDTTQGRRRDAVSLGDLPPNVQPGDYWKCRGLTVAEPSNLTGTVWGFYAPNGAGIGTLRLHTVRENDDETASVLPNDGSSNSILISGGTGRSWHGYLERGVWREV